MRVNKIFSGMNVMNHGYLIAFHKTLVKRYIKGCTIKDLKDRVEKYNSEFLKEKGMYLFYDDLTIESIAEGKYYLRLNGNEFHYHKDNNTLLAV